MATSTQNGAQSSRRLRARHAAIWLVLLLGCDPGPPWSEGEPRGSEPGPGPNGNASPDAGAAPDMRPAGSLGPEMRLPSGVDAAPNVRSAPDMLVEAGGLLDAPVRSTEDGGLGVPKFTAAEWDIVKGLSGLPPTPPADPTNRYADHPGAAQLGQMLFYDPDYTGKTEGARTCQSCHVGFAGNQRLPGVPVPMYGGRDILALVNSSYYTWSNWGGRFATQWELPLILAERPDGFNSSRLRIVRLMFEKYRAEYEAAFEPLDPGIGSDPRRYPREGRPKAVGQPDGPWEGMAAADQERINRAYVNHGKALAAYVRLLRSANAPFDRFVAGDRAALSESAQRGLAVFIGKGACVTCHSGPFLTDQKFHDLGYGTARDRGRVDDLTALLISPFNPSSAYSDDPKAIPLEPLRGSVPDAPPLFRTPTLRNVAQTLPYMHDGALLTLDAVIEFHDRGGVFLGGRVGAELKPLGLWLQEKTDLRAFLDSLTGDPVPAHLVRDTSRRLPP